MNEKNSNYTSIVKYKFGIYKLKWYLKCFERENKYRIYYKKQIAGRKIWKVKQLPKTVKLNFCSTDPASFVAIQV